MPEKIPQSSLTRFKKRIISISRYRWTLLLKYLSYAKSLIFPFSSWKEANAEDNSPKEINCTKSKVGLIFIQQHDRHSRGTALRLYVSLSASPRVRRAGRSPSRPESEKSNIKYIAYPGHKQLIPWVTLHLKAEKSPPVKHCIYQQSCTLESSAYINPNKKVLQGKHHFKGEICLSAPACAWVEVK